MPDKMDLEPSPYGDFVLPFDIAKAGVRGRLVRLDAASARALGAHVLPEPAARVTGEMVALGALLGTALKLDGRLTIQTKGDGPLDLEHRDHALLEAVAAVHEGRHVVALLPQRRVRREHEEGVLRHVVLERRQPNLEHVRLARRLVQRGVRFVEVGFNLNFINGAGWDTHNAAQKDQYQLIRRLDQGVATLINDLKSNALLDKTLIVIASEFGRPASFDGGGGRGHYGKCFTVMLAGGGLRTGQAVGVTDELAMNIVDEPCGVPDLFATILATLRVSTTKNLMDGERPVPVTDGGKAVAKLFV